MTSSSSTQGSKIFPLRLIVSLIIMFHYGTKTFFFSCLSQARIYRHFRCTM